ncbi:MAG: GGDEF domain-containing protein [Oscillatoriales cyanobacterium]|nr:MAG: GGDEF domain-containing protein [Oscillatoriales cyanobacterium]
MFRTPHRRRFRDDLHALSQLLKIFTLLLSQLRQYCQAGLVQVPSAAYCQRFLTNDVRNARVAIALICIAIQVYAALIEIWSESRSLQVSTTFKYAIISYALWTIWNLRRVHNHSELHFRISTMMAIALVGIFYANSLLTGEAAHHALAIEVDMVQVILWYGLAPGASFVVGFWAVCWSLINLLAIKILWLDAPVEVQARQVALMIGVNGLGLGWIYLRSRWREAQLAKEAEQHNRDELERMAFTDELTGVMNRRRLLQRLVPWVEEYRLDGGDPPALLLSDLDRFKLINDTYGHEAGDQVLQAFAQATQDRLHQTLGDRALFGRLGGEEFLIAIVAANSAEAQAVALDIGQTCRNLEVRSQDGNLIRFTTSIGYTLIAEYDSAIVDAIARADAALYRAKHNGRDRVEWEPIPNPPGT